MSRRRRADDSSLELLLDTICNTFGGILFLAMLVSLLLQTTRNRAAASATSSEPQKPALAKSEVIRLSSQARELAEEVRRLEADLSRVRQFVKEFAAPGFEESLKHLHAAQQHQLTLEAKRAELLSTIAAENTAAVTAINTARATRHKAELAEVTAQEAAVRLKTAEQRHEALTKAAVLLQEKVDKKNVVQSTGKAPRERETTKREFGVLVRYGRAYLTHIHDGFDRTVNTNDFTIESGIRMNTAKAKPGAGLDICGMGADATLQRLLQAYPASEWYPCIVVHPDSYDAFQILKSKLVKRGYEYRVVATDKPVADQGGRGRVQ